MHPIFIVLLALLGVAAIYCLVATCLASALHKKMFGYRFSHDPLITTYTPDMFDLESEPIEVNVGGDTVRGALFHQRGREYDKSVIVVVCHGMWSSHKSYMQEIGYLCSKGFRTVGFDYVGTGISDGEELGGFGQSLRCLDGIVTHIKNDPELSKCRIYVLGHSWGGYAATNIVKFHPDITGVIAIAPAASFDAVAKSNFPKSIYFLIPFAKLIDKLKLGRFANRRAVKSFKGYNGSVLILHSKDDAMCPFDMTTAQIMKRYGGDNFNYYVTEGKFHNPHYTAEGLALMNEFNEKLSKLSDEDEKNEYKKTVDFIAMGALDTAVMDIVAEHIK